MREVSEGGTGLILALLQFPMATPIVDGTGTSNGSMAPDTGT